MEDSQDLFKRIQRFFEKESRRKKLTRLAVLVCATAVFPTLVGLLSSIVFNDGGTLFALPPDGLSVVFLILILLQAGFIYLTTVRWQGAPTYYDVEQLQRHHEREKKRIQGRFERARDNLDSMIRVQEATRYASMALGNAATLAAEDDDPTNDLEQGIELVLNSCVTFRSDIFGFRAKDLYNFAVYLYCEDEDVLHLAWRKCDSRIDRTDREWKPGEGHVGLCYARKSEIFSNNVPDSDELERDEPEDDEKYVSMVSIPIFQSGDFPISRSSHSGVDQDAEPLGVFVVTSSAPNQFDEELHKSFLLSLSFHLSFVIERVLNRPESRSC
jgi:hypothetical protein